jgi:hypothetical protein
MQERRLLLALPFSLVALLDRFLDVLQHGAEGRRLPLVLFGPAQFLLRQIVKAFICELLVLHLFVENGVEAPRIFAALGLLGTLEGERRSAPSLSLLARQQLLFPDLSGLAAFVLSSLGRAAMA